MKVLVFSDSHGSRSFMERCVQAVKPQAIFHLGDFYRDGEALAAQFPDIPMYQVLGNCDGYSWDPSCQTIRLVQLDGVNFYLTHGHKHQVKSYLGRLLQDARASGVDGVLYGHTHQADCHREPDGLWVMNPGSSGEYGGSAGVIRIQNGAIADMYLVYPRHLP